MSIKVKTRKGKVSAPKALRNTSPKPKTGIRPRATMVMMLGQSMEMPIHMRMEPKKIPRTCMESWFRPSGTGTSLEPSISARAAARITLRFTRLPCPAFVPTDIKNLPAAAPGRRCFS